jgi:lipoyl(octanoyl) transferase
MQPEISTRLTESPGTPASASPTAHSALLLRRALGIVPYEPTWHAQQTFTAQRGPETPDELWLLQHPPVYTLGLAGDVRHLLEASEIPLVKIDRGGQITYHAPGQAVVYLLIDLARRKLKVREQVRLMEQAMLDVLSEFGVAASRHEGAPGVYVGDAKIGALGLKISRGCSFHGLSLNVDLDMRPYLHINPCGYAGLRSTSLVEEGVNTNVNEVLDKLASKLTELLERDYPIANIET